MRLPSLVIPVVLIALSLGSALWYQDVGLCNAGGPWGISMPFFLLIPVSIVIVGLLGLQWSQARHPSAKMAWMLLLAGGLANLTERIAFGCVRDYIQLGAFPAFNLADVFLTIGVLGLFRQVFGHNKES